MLMSAETELTLAFQRRHALSSNRRSQLCATAVSLAVLQRALDIGHDVSSIEAAGLLGMSSVVGML